MRALPPRAEGGHLEFGVYRGKECTLVLQLGSEKDSDLVYIGSVGGVLELPFCRRGMGQVTLPPGWYKRGKEGGVLKGHWWKDKVLRAARHEPHHNVLRGAFELKIILCWHAAHEGGGQYDMQR